MVTALSRAWSFLQNAAVVSCVFGFVFGCVFGFVISFVATTPAEPSATITPAPTPTDVTATLVRTSTTASCGKSIWLSSPGLDELNDTWSPGAALCYAFSYDDLWKERVWNTVLAWLVRQNVTRSEGGAGGDPLLGDAVLTHTHSQITSLLATLQINETLQSLRRHYLKHGIKEGRTWGCPNEKIKSKMQHRLGVISDITPSNALCYYQRYPDLHADHNLTDVFSDPTYIHKHFSLHGESEGRIWGCDPSVQEQMQDLDKVRRSNDRHPENVLYRIVAQHANYMLPIAIRLADQPYILTEHSEFFAGHLGDECRSTKDEGKYWRNGEPEKEKTISNCKNVEIQHARGYQQLISKDSLWQPVVHIKLKAVLLISAFFKTAHGYTNFWSRLIGAVKLTQGPLFGPHALVVYRATDKGMQEIIEHCLRLQLLTATQLVFVDVAVNYRFDQLFLMDSHHHDMVGEWDFALEVSRFVETNFLRYQACEVRPTHLPKAVGLFKVAGAAQYTNHDGEVPKAEVERLLLAFNATLIMPDVIGELALIRTLAQCEILVTQWGSAFTKNFVYLGDACKKIIIFLHSRIHEDQISALAEGQKLLKHWRNADIEFRLPDGSLWHP